MAWCVAPIQTALRSALFPMQIILPAPSVAVLPSRGISQFQRTAARYPPE